MRRKRVSLILSLGALMILLIGAVSFAPTFFDSGIFRVFRGDITAAFAHDLGDYVGDHSGTLPPDWSAFTIWMKDQKHSERWKASDLKKRFAIRLFKQQTSTEPPEYITVLDQTIFYMQDYINRCVHYSQKNG